MIVALIFEEGYVATSAAVSSKRPDTAVGCEAQDPITAAKISARCRLIESVDVMFTRHDPGENDVVMPAEPIASQITPSLPAM